MISLFLFFYKEPPNSEVDSFLKSISSTFSKGKNPSLILFVIAIILILMFLVIVKYMFEVRRTRKKLEEIIDKRDFPKINQERDFRNSKRVKVFREDNVQVRFKEGEHKDETGILLDISRGGMSFEPNFPLRRMYVDEMINNFEIVKGTTKILIKKAKVVRIQHLYHKRVIAFRFLDMDLSNRDQLVKLISNLEKEK